jgi:hypothetical protein
LDARSGNARPIILIRTFSALRRFLPVAAFAGGILVLMPGCGGTPTMPVKTRDQCIEERAQRLRDLPERRFLKTLDGQQVPLAAFYAQCERLWPNCVLYQKFYHWKHEVIDVTSQTAKGKVHHQVRIYHNILSTCSPEPRDPGRTHGDVAEFYDPDGKFMGLAVYMGKGLYVPLLFSGYQTNEGRSP